MSTADLLSIASGLLSGFALGLIGGGGSILATPLLLYVVGLGSPHLAIGTGAVAVAIAALFSFFTHAKAGHVRWRSAIVFAIIGVAGALLGSTIGKAFDGKKLIFLFGVLMVVVGIEMMRRPDHDDVSTDYGGRSDKAVAGLALVAGAASGFFGIGGGFLIVPCLLYATKMPMIDAVGTSLLAVTAFSFATAANYAVGGLVDWPIAAWFVTGGIVGGGLGMSAAAKLAVRKGLLRKIFAVLILAAAAYLILRNVKALF